MIVDSLVEKLDEMNIGGTGFNMAELRKMLDESLDKKLTALNLTTDSKAETPSAKPVTPDEGKAPMFASPFPANYKLDTRGNCLNMWEWWHHGKCHHPF